MSSLNQQQKPQIPIQIQMTKKQSIRQSQLQDKKSPSLSSQQTIKIRQFQWYQIQTKVRQLMGQILQPFNKKQTQQTVKINQLKRNITSIFKRHQQYDFLLQQGSPQKPKYLQLQDQKIALIQEKMNNKQLQVQGRVNKMQNTLKVYQQKIKQLNNLQIKLDHQIKQRIKAFDSYKQTMDSKSNNLITRIQAQNDQINTIRGNTRNHINKIQLKLVSIQNRVRQVEDQHKRKTGQIQKLSDNVLGNNQKVIKLQSNLIQLDQRLKIRQLDVKMSQKFFRVVDDVKNDLGFVKSYLERYQPLYTQMQISDTLNSFLTGKAKRMLCLYQQQAYAKFHFDILQGGKSSTNSDQIISNIGNDLQQKMSQYSDKIKSIITKNKKYIIKYKVNKAIKLGQNVYEVRMIDQNTPDQQQQENKKPINVVVPQQDIRKIIQIKWIQLIPKLNQRVSEQLKPTKLWIQQLQQQAILRAAKTDQKLQTLKKQIQLTNADFQLFKNHTQSTLVQNSKKIQNYSKVHYSLIENIKDIINFGSVINHIVIQDQIDRQGLALYALKSGKNSNHNQNSNQNQISQIQKIYPTIQLDQKCVACKSNSSTALVNQSFKMACLAYNPSQIRIDDQTFSREQILQVSTNILEKLKNKVDNVGKKQLETSINFVEKKVRNVVGSRRSQSQFSKQTKSNTLNASRTIDSRSKQMQTLLPVLSTSKKSQKMGNLTQRSFLY